jgi:hypothetical protein
MSREKTLKQQNRQVKDRDKINSDFCLVLPESEHLRFFTGMLAFNP